MDEQITKEKKAMDNLAGLVNSYSFSSELFAKEIRNQHPTLQARIFDCCMDVLYQMRVMCELGIYDERNEKACKKAKAIWDNISKDIQDDIIDSDTQIII